MRVRVVSQKKNTDSKSFVRRQHYIPAVYLSRFSYDSSPRSRERSVFALRRGQSAAIQSKVQKLGFINNFYTLAGQSFLAEGKEWDPYAIERLWQGIEGSLTGAMDRLVDSNNRTIPTQIWARTLVPFVASMFIRGPSFNKEYEGRFPFLDINAEENREILSVDNTNMSRLLELQRLLAPVAASRWMVLHVTAGAPIITNDLGYAYFYCPTTREPGYVFPLGPTAALGIIPSDTNIVSEGRWPGSWKTSIYHHNLQPHAQGGLNKALARAAQDFIFGPTEASVTRWRSVMAESRNQPFPGFLTRFTSKTRRENEFLWHRLVSTIAFTPGDTRVGEFKLIPKNLADGWTPVLFFPIERAREARSLFYDVSRIFAHMPDDVVTQSMFMDHAIANDKSMPNVWPSLPTVRGDGLGIKSGPLLRAVMIDAVHSTRPPVDCQVPGCQAEYC